MVIIDIGKQRRIDPLKGYHYYRCARAKGKDAICNNSKYVRQEVFDEQIYKELSKLPIPPRILEWIMKLLKKCYLEENKFMEGKRMSLQRNINNEKAKLERLTSKWLSESN